MTITGDSTCRESPPATVRSSGTAASPRDLTRSTESARRRAAATTGPSSHSVPHSASHPAAHPVAWSQELMIWQIPQLTRIHNGSSLALRISFVASSSSGSQKAPSE
eukprot:s4235_g8.t1